MIKPGFRYKIKYVKEGSSTYGDFTSFQIGDKIDGSDGKWFNARVTINGHCGLQDGQEVKLAKLNSFKVREYEGKLQYDIGAEIEVNDGFEL